MTRITPEAALAMGAARIREAVTEKELQNAAVAPRVTEDFAESYIAGEYYFTAADGARATNPVIVEHASDLGLLTICVLVLKNGFTVMGQSACAAPENFNAEIGKRLARQDAKNKVWGFHGFTLKTKLAMLAEADSPSDASMTRHVGTKVVHAKPMTRGGYNEFRGWKLPDNEYAEDEGYLVEYPDSAGYVSWSPKAVFEQAYGKPL